MTAEVGTAQPAPRIRSISICLEGEEREETARGRIWRTLRVAGLEIRSPNKEAISMEGGSLAPVLCP